MKILEKFPTGLRSFTLWLKIEVKMTVISVCRKLYFRTYEYKYLNSNLYELSNKHIFQNNYQYSIVAKMSDYI